MGDLDGPRAPRAIDQPGLPGAPIRKTRGSDASQLASAADSTRLGTMGDGGHLDDPITGQHLTFMKTGAETGGDLLQVEVRLDAGGRVPRHAHLRQDERVEVIRGSLTARVGGRDHELRPGDRLDVPRRRLHVIRNAAEHETRFVLEVRPARHMEQAMKGLFAVMRPLGRILRKASDR